MDGPNGRTNGRLTCHACSRPLDPHAAEVDDDGYAACERCAGYRSGYVDGRADAFRDATTAVVAAAETAVIRRVRDDVERLLEAR